MTILATVRIDGPPTAKGRPRFTRLGRAYTPGKTREAEGYIRHQIVEQAGMLRLEGALRVTVVCFMAMPGSWSKIKQARAVAGFVQHIGRPDLDNLAKAVLDAANGYLWCDDSQIVALVLSKHYSKRPGVRLTVEAA
jgi:Holliday junction resolvase RusA-like endonuclease